jgi:hypothetical protein
MRAYAGAIGLDPEATLKEFLERFPDPEAPPPPLTILPAGAPAVVPDTRSAATRFLGAWFRPGALVRGFRVRCLAAAADLFVIWVLGVACFAVFGQLWAPLSVAAVTYYGLGILVLGNTPGVCFFADAGKAFSQGHALPFKLRLPRLRRGPAHASEPPPLAQR